MQISPPKHLTSYIKHYIFLENSEDNIKKLRLFTDGNTGLILSDNINILDTSGKDLPLSFFYGQLTQYKDLFIKGRFSLIAVVFQPYFFNAFLGISAKEVLDQIISVKDVVKNEMCFFQEKLSYKIDPKLIINDLNAYFTKILSKVISSDYDFVTAVQHYILQNKGSVTLKDLEYFTGYSERHIERKFKNYMGVSPKKYSNIARLHYFLSLINCNINHESITGLSYNAGYADQSHLIKEFKNNIGLTPNQYLKTENKLAVNFIELNSN